MSQAVTHQRSRRASFKAKHSDFSELTPLKQHFKLYKKIYSKSHRKTKLRGYPETLFSNTLAETTFEERTCPTTETETRHANLAFCHTISGAHQCLT